MASLLLSMGTSALLPMRCPHGLHSYQFLGLCACVCMCGVCMHVWVCEYSDMYCACVGECDVCIVVYVCICEVCLIYVCMCVMCIGFVGGCVCLCVMSSCVHVCEVSVSSSGTTCKIGEGSEVYCPRDSTLLTKCFRVKSVKRFLIAGRCGVAGTVDTAPTAPVVGLAPQALGCWGRVLGPWAGTGAPRGMPSRPRLSAVV